ncbi:PREDICTED: uncharacterized protein LOC108382945 [Rhagoletis zephyria]|uniref:uncharacterized protein LOC108382945 n=1 Tax=Rhagoletis zephyria TaxID=28612 RepID=UPI00081130A2|nr:PREDICTED: uncharacterized protein LOC108382945 [Rhagoletis zephyria]
MDDYAVEEDEDECDCLQRTMPAREQVVEEKPPPPVEVKVTEMAIEPNERDCKLSTSEEQLRSKPFSPLKHCIPKRSLTLPRILVPRSAFGSSGGGAAGSGRSGGGRGGF